MFETNLQSQQNGEEEKKVLRRFEALFLAQIQLANFMAA